MVGPSRPWSSFCDDRRAVLRNAAAKLVQNECPARRASREDRRMHPSPRHCAAEAEFRELVSNADLDAPDDVEYTPASLIFRWRGPMVAVVVELDDQPGAA